MEDLQQRLAAVKEDLTRSLSREGAAAERIQQMESWLRELGESARRMEELERRFAVVGRISDAASGRNAQRITFQRFVLATLRRYPAVD